MEDEKLIKQWVQSSLFENNDLSIFERIVKKMDDYYYSTNSFGGSITENNIPLRHKSQKVKGNLFEILCLKLIQTNQLKGIGEIRNAWLLRDLPNEQKEKLGLTNRDVGIDIIIQKNEQTWYAVQIKYKQVARKNNSYSRYSKVLGWRALSTFYALVERTGPWNKYIIMTNCEAIKREGKKTSKDFSFCLKSFRSIPLDTWRSICNMEGKTLNQEEKKPISKEELREKRLAYFN